MTSLRPCAQANTPAASYSLCPRQPRLDKSICCEGVPGAEPAMHHCCLEICTVPSMLNGGS